MSDKPAVVQAFPSPAGLKLVEPETLFERINQIHENIARRAFEFFENGGGELGHELDHWFKAEAELLHPIHINVTQTDGTVKVQAEVPGFNADELKVSLEPKRLTITGKRETSKEDKKKGKVIYSEHCSNELLRIVDLPVEVNTAKASAIVNNGVLELSVPTGAQAKATRLEVKAA